MTTNPREELARIIDEHEWSRHHGGSRGEQIADILIEHGWRKVDPDAETHTEWGVRRPEKYGSTVAWVGGRRPAQSLAEAWGDGNVVVSRTVHVGPWEAEQ